MSDTPQHPPVHLYAVRYFDAVQWRWISRNVLAFTAAQVRDSVDKELPAQFRNKPRYGAQAQSLPAEDSLSIADHGPVDMPYHLDGNG